MDPNLNWSIVQEKIRPLINRPSPKNQEILVKISKENPELLFKNFKNAEVCALSNIISLGQDKTFLSIFKNIDFKKHKLQNQNHHNFLHLLFYHIFSFEKVIFAILESLCASEPALLKQLLNEKDFINETPISKLINNNDLFGRKSKIIKFLSDKNLLPKELNFYPTKLIEIIDEDPEQILKILLKNNPEIVNSHGDCLVTSDNTLFVDLLKRFHLFGDKLNSVYSEMFKHYKPSGYNDVRTLIMFYNNFSQDKNIAEIVQQIIFNICSDKPQLLVSNNNEESAWQLAFRYHLPDHLIIKIATSTPHLTLRVNDIKIKDYIMRYSPNKISLLDIIFEERTINNILTDSAPVANKIKSNKI